MRPATLLQLLLPFILAATALAPAPPTPRDELLRLVPDDVAFCLVVQDLRGHLGALKDSPFAAQFKASPLGQAVKNAPELAKLADVESFLKLHLGTDWPQLRDDILGDAIVFAYRPGPPGKPEQEQGLFLVRSRSDKALAALVDRLNKAQQAFGELKKLDERQHHGVTYYARTETKQPPSYYFLHGPILAFSHQEAMLQRAIDLDRQPRAGEAELPFVARQLRQLDADKALAALWVNPRAFDAELQQRVAATPPAEATALKNFIRYWHALDGVAATVALRHNLELNVAVRVKPDGLPPAARRFLAEAAEPSALWQTMPKDALFAAAFRCDAEALTDMAKEFMDEDARTTLRDSLDKPAGPVVGKALRDLRTCLGPDTGMYIAAPPAGGKSWCPEAAWMVRVRPGQGSKPADQTLLDALNFVANLAVLDHNSKNDDRLVLKTVQQDKVEVKYFVDDQRFPPGLQPAYALKDGFLVLASSPEAVRRFRGDVSLAPESAAEVPLMRWSFTALRSYLKDQREPLVAAVAEKDKVTKQEAAKRLDALASGLQFVDHIELVQRPGAGQVILTLRVRPSQPLRK